jgi:hypothetical protein
MFWMSNIQTPVHKYEAINSVILLYNMNSYEYQLSVPVYYLLL